MTEKTKKCASCWRVLPLTKFYQTDSKKGRQARCKDCKYIAKAGRR